MSNMRDAPVLKAVADVVKDHVSKAFGVLRGQIDELREQIKSLPKPEKGEPGPRGNDGLDGKDGKDGIDGKDGVKGADAAPVDINAVVKAVLKEVPTPKDGKDGSNGKDAEPIDVSAMVDSIIDAVTKKIPAPVNGKDAEPVDYDRIIDAVTKKIPVPANGKDGANGKDAEPVDTKTLADEIVVKVLGQIPAPVHGKDGRDGKDAEQLDVNDIVSKILGQIPPPIPGKDGKDIDPDVLSARVVSEVAKAVAALPKPANGRDGRDGRGEKGENGKDALDIDILNGIDETASYQRGIFARHRNGLFRAYRTTDPVIGKNFADAGWMCIVPGTVDIVESLAPDGRTVVRTHEQSDGTLFTTSYKTPAIIYRGVFKDGSFEPGDAVTSAGAMWICRESTSDKPGMTKAWTLAVKRGSDGKDAK